MADRRLWVVMAVVVAAGPWTPTLGLTIPAVDKIVGPGNVFVATAKRMVFGEVDIDSIAGPSESCWKRLDGLFALALGGPA